MKEFITQVFQGKSLGRILFNRQVALHCADLQGEVLDLAGGGSYYRFLSKTAHVITTNRNEQNDSAIVDFNQPLPFSDTHFDSVLFFNALYIVEQPEQLLTEIARVLKPNGQLYLFAPFLAHEMPEPHDYARYTREGLQRFCAAAGLTEISCEAVGEHFSACAGLLHSFYVFNTIRLMVYSLALLLDHVVPWEIKKHHPAPLGYFYIATKL